jgi:Flp pilus assembly protein CpaB
MKKRNQLIWTCGVSIMILLTLYVLLHQQKKSDDIEIFLLNKNLSAGSIIASDMIRSVKIPKETILPNACKSREEIIGMFALTDMKKDGILSAEDIAIEQNGVSYKNLKEGDVLYTLALKPEDANGWWLAKGNIVDLLLLNQSGYKAESETADEPGVFIDVIESVRILRIMDETGEQIDTGEKPARLVCLELTMEQAKAVFKTENTKRIKIVAKNHQ